MCIVAIAGGLGDVGRTIAEQIIQSGNHIVHILTRKSTTPRECPSHLPVPIAIDYTSVEEIRETLLRLQADTVISTLNLHWPGASDSQINLIRGAAASGVVTRFIPSEFNVDYHCPEECLPYGPRLEFLRAEAELNAHPQLTYSLIRCGFFMDYLGLPYASTNLHPLYCLVDLSASKAVLPGDGNDHVVFTHTQDVGRFVAALLGLEASKWPKEVSISGQRLTTNELVNLVDKRTGTQFERHHVPVSALRKNIVEELPSNNSCYPYFPGGREDLNSVICPQMVGMISGVFDIRGTDLSNLFTNVEKTQLGPFIEECWKEHLKSSQRN